MTPRSAFLSPIGYLEGRKARLTRPETDLENSGSN